MVQIVHRPNSIIQELYLSSQVDEVGGFGQKGWGKSWAVLHECLQDINQPDFSAVIFRRTSSDFEDLWNKSLLHFAGFKPDSNHTKHTHIFPSGARVKFAHLQHIKDVYTYNGQEYQLIIFDELPQFPIMPYLFMFSCLRGTNPNVPKRIRSTGNPLGEGMLQVKARFFDQLRPTTVTEDGRVIKGEVGWFRMEGSKDVRASKEIERDLFQLCREPNWRELKSKDPRLKDYLSREWYFGDRRHNTDLTKGDPDYESRLQQLPEREKRAFLLGLFEIQNQDDQLIMGEWWEAAVNGKNKVTKGERNFGLDYAELGKDKSVLCFGEGNQVQGFTEWDYMPHPAMADEIEKIFLMLGKFQARGGIDTVGTGAGVYTALQAKGDVYAERTDPIRYFDPTAWDAKHEKQAIKWKFSSFQARIIWQLRLDFQAGNIDLSPLLTKEHFYENLYLLQEEALAFWYSSNGDKIDIATSNELRKTERTNKYGNRVPSLGRSPDRLKALAIWNYVRQNRVNQGKFELPRIDRYDEPMETDLPGSPWT